MSMAELRDGKFVSDHFYFDGLGVLRQMALMPPLAITERPLGQAALWLGVAGGKLVRSVIRSARPRAGRPSR
jgi:hypothetical protein